MVDPRLGGISSACVDDRTLAAFVDGTLDPDSRSLVVAHIASCPDCSELVAEVIRTEEELQESTATLLDAPITPPLDKVDDRSPNTPFWTNRYTFAAAGGLLAVAASVLLLVPGRGSPLAPLVSIVGNERLTEARPTGAFRYGPLRSPVRGSTNTDNLELRAEALRLRERADRTGAAEDLHASGIAQLLAGETTESVGTLESAARLRPDDASYRADVGAAYMSRFLAQGHQADAAAALDAFDTALARSSTLAEAAFNKALLLERLDRRADAVAAWNRYLELPDEPGWRDEAVRRRDDLQGQRKSG
jgi:hypothetical protein